jgi:hypothetical protein
MAKKSQIPVYTPTARADCDGNNVKEIAHNPRPLQVEVGHHYHTNPETGRRVDHPDYCPDSTKDY